MRHRTPFLGIEFDAVTTDEAARAVAERARRLGPFGYVATPNVDHLVRLDRRPELGKLYSGAWMTLCDSRIIELFAEASHVDLAAAPGADLVERLFRNHIRTDDTVVVVGATKEVVAALRERFQLSDLRWFDAPPGLADSADGRKACVGFIRENPSSYVFLAVGSPQQEMIAHEAQLAGDCAGVAICCGAALEFLAGLVPRAPRGMRTYRLEWLYRLAREPARLWRRYLVDGPRIFVIWHRWRSAVPIASVTTGDVAVSSRW
jgi:exopolysaccharide biosynthesis WecB/TagA/CpsF family protein